MINMVEIPRNYFACERIPFVILVLSVIALVSRSNVFITSSGLTFMKAAPNCFREIAGLVATLF